MSCACSPPPWNAWLRRWGWKRRQPVCCSKTRRTVEEGLPHAYIFGGSVTESGLRADVEEFILRHLDSVEQMEVLLLLRRRRNEQWDAAAVARELRIDATSAARRLADLFGKDLLVREKDEQFRYSSKSSHDAAIQALEQAYNERPVSVISFLFSKPTDNSIRLFSDAFRLRKQDDS